MIFKISQYTVVGPECRGSSAGGTVGDPQLPGDGQLVTLCALLSSVMILNTKACPTDLGQFHHDLTSGDRNPMDDGECEGNHVSMGLVIYFPY